MLEKILKCPELDSYTVNEGDIVIYTTGAETFNFQRRKKTLFKVAMRGYSTLILQTLQGSEWVLSDTKLDNATFVKALDFIAINGYESFMGLVSLDEAKRFLEETGYTATVPSADITHASISNESVRFNTEFLNKSKGNKLMNSIKDIANKNTAAAKSVAKVEAGRTLTNLIITKTKMFFPGAVQDYVDSPLGAVVIANVVSFLVDSFLENNAKATWAGEAMVEAALADLLADFDLAGLLEGFLSSVPDLQED